MAADPRCEQAHAKILAATCPWCLRWIADGQPFPSRSAWLSRPSSEGPAVQFPRGVEALAQLIRQKLLDKLDLSRVGELEKDPLRTDLRQVVERLSDMHAPLMNHADRARLIDAVLDGLFKDGPKGGE